MTSSSSSRGRGRTAARDRARPSAEVSTIPARATEEPVVEVWAPVTITGGIGAVECHRPRPAGPRSRRRSDRERLACRPLIVRLSQLATQTALGMPRAPGGFDVVGLFRVEVDPAGDEHDVRADRSSSSPCTGDRSRGALEPLQGPDRPRSPVAEAPERRGRTATGGRERPSRLAAQHVGSVVSVVEEAEVVHEQPRVQMNPARRLLRLGSRLTSARAVAHRAAGGARDARAPGGSTRGRRDPWPLCASGRRAGS